MDKNENMEVRVFPVGEIRAGGEGEPKISGYAAVFNSLSGDLGGFVERIAPGAFKKTLEGDVRAFWNHNSDFVLGRTRAKTLALSEDEAGLRFEIDPPETTWAKDALVSMRRGDVDQMSFGFRTIRDDWEQAGDQVIRTLVEVELFEVSPVAIPAYPQTSAQVRSNYEAFRQSMAEEPAKAEEEPEADTNGQEPGGEDGSGGGISVAQARAQLRRIEIEDLKNNRSLK